MSISIACPGCQKRFTAPDQFAGRNVRCTACTTAFAVPLATVAQHPAPAQRLTPLTVTSVRRSRRIGFGAWATLGVLTFVLVAGAGFTAWRITRSASVESSTPAALALPYLPDGSDMVACVNMESFLSGRTLENVLKRLKEQKSDKYEKAQADYASQWAEWEKKLHAEIKPGLGLTPADIRWAVLGGVSTRNEAIWVVRTHKPVTSQAIGSLLKTSPQPTKVGAFTVYEAISVQDTPVAFCLPDDYTIVAAENVEQLRKALERGGPAKLAPQTTALLKQVSFAKTFALVFNAREYLKQQAEKPKEPSKPGTLNIDIAKMLPPEWQPLTRSHAFALELDTRSGFELSCAVTCQDAADGDALRNVLNGGLTALRERYKQQIADTKVPAEQALLKNALTLFERIKVSGAGDTVTATVAITDDLLTSLIESSPPKLPGVAPASPRVPAGR